MDQLNRAMKGEKDLHDLIVEKHERQMRLEYDNQMTELKRLREEAPDFGGFLHQSVEIFDPSTIGSHLRRLAQEREQRRDRRRQEAQGQLTGSKRLEVLSRLTPPKALEVSKAPLIDDLTVRMSPDESVTYIRPDGTDMPIREDD
jgi:hypothetical protein